MNELKNVRVLVPQAEALGMIGVIRSLGSAGLEVHAASSQSNALGLRSNFTSKALVCPPMEHPEYIDWLRSYCLSEKIKILIPTEGLMLALRDGLKDFDDILPISTEPEKILLAYSKARTHQLYESKGLYKNTPPALVFTQENYEQLKSRLNELDFPVFVKTDAIDSLSIESGGGRVLSAKTSSKALAIVQELLFRSSHVVVQGYIEGKGAGVNCLRWNGEYPAVFLNYCDHESPHKGGLSTLRRGWDCPEMREDAKNRLDALDWQGVAMVEYKVNPLNGNFSCIEINARFWAALHLALYSGANFPLYLSALHAGFPVNIPKKWNEASCCYDVPGEIAHVSSMLKDSEIGLAKKMASIVTFFSHYFNPKVKFDLYYPGDRKLYFINLLRFLGF